MLAASFCALMMVLMVLMMVAPMRRGDRKASHDEPRDGDDPNARPS